MSFLHRFKSDQLLALGSITALFAVSLLLAQRPHSLGHDPNKERQGSSHYPSPLGGKAFYTLLERMGRGPIRQQRSIELLPEKTQAVLLLAPPESPAAEEVTWLKDWVTRGGTLVLCPRGGTEKTPVDPLLAAFGLELKETPDPKAVELEGSLRPLDPQEGRSYTLSIRHGFRLLPAATEKLLVPLVQDERGWVAAVAPRGQGRLIALADSDFYDNEGISRADNVAFMVRLADLISGGSPVVFDEFHHGFRDGQDAFSILWASPSMRPVMLLSVLAGIFGIIASGRRLGPPVDEHLERRRRPGEFIDAFAGLCRKHHSAPQALSMVLTEFRLHLQQAYGAGTPEALERISARAGLDPSALSSALDRATRVTQSARIDEDAFVSCCRELESLRRTLHPTHR